MRVFTKLKTEAPHDPVTALLGIHPNKTIIHKDTCPPRSLQHRSQEPGRGCSLMSSMSTDRRTDRGDVGHTDHGILLSHEKEWNGAIGRTWTDLETVIQSEISQEERSKHHITSLTRAI